MIQVATFLLPQEQEKANEFLKTHHPDAASGGINFNRDMIVIFYDDGVMGKQREISSWREYLYGAENTMKNILISQTMCLRDIEIHKHGTRAYDDANTALRELNERMAELTYKIDFVKGKIAELEKDESK
jgi:hypothetical protein